MVWRVVCWVGAVLDAGCVDSLSDSVAGVSLVAESSLVGWAVAEAWSVSGLDVGSSSSVLAGREGEEGSLVEAGFSVAEGCF